MIDIVTCPNCNRRLQVQDDIMGKQVQCPSCETTFTAGETKPRPQPAPVPDAVTSIPAAKAPTRDDDRDRDLPRRPRRTERRPLPPAKTGGRTALAVIGIVVLCIAVVTGIIVSASHQRPMPPVVNFGQPPQNFGQNFNFGQPPPAVDVPDRILEPKDQKDHARRFFEHFSGVMRNEADAGGEKAAFDAAGLLAIALDKKLIPAWQMNNRFQLETDFREGVRKTSLYRGAIHWGTYHVMTVQQPKARELVVVTRHPNDNTNASLHMRWWLRHINGRWLITEMEDMDNGIRLTSMLAAGLAGAEQQAWTMRDAADAIVISSDDAKAERLLGNVQAKNLPARWEATHHVLMASIRSRQRRWAEAIAECTLALRAEPDTPGADFLMAVCLNDLRRDADALKHARVAHKAYGDDPSVCYEIGVASANTGQFVEAAANYRKTLDANPNHKNAFLSLLRSVGPGVKNDDIGERLRKMRNPGAEFKTLADDCWLVRDTSTLTVLADAMLQIDPRHAEAHFYRSLVHADQEKLGPALASFRSALGMQDFDGRRDFYYSEFARCVVFRDMTMQAYGQLPDQRRAFRAIGEELKITARMDELQNLITVHVKKWPNDPFVHLFRAELQMRDEQYALADKSFTKAFAEINDPQLVERFRFNRINARYLAGDVLGAYHGIGPQRLSFQQLANACWEDKKMAELSLLVDAHAKDDPIDPQLARFRWRLAIHDKRFDNAANALRTVFGRNVNNESDRRHLEDFLYDMIDTGNALEGYRRAPDRQLALEIISMDLAGGNRGDDFKTILSEHRKAFPNDPLLHMYAGQQAADKQDWFGAVSAYQDGWPRLAPAKQPRWTYAYLYAAVKLGQPVQAYRDMGARSDQFRQLAGMLVLEKQVDKLEELVTAQRAQVNRDPELPAYEARVKLLRGKPAEAADEMLAFLKDRPFNEQQRIGDSFLNDVAAYDLAVEAYRCMPDKRDAFAYMTFKYRQPERVKEFARLINEHAKQFASDPRLRIERAELHLLQKNFVVAEKEFAEARRLNPKDNLARFGLIRARIRLGKAAETYRELGANTLAFTDVANQCVYLKDGVELEKVLSAHRKAFPTIKNLAAWDVEVRYHKKDYEGVVKDLQTNRALLKNAQSRWKCEGYLVRSLVRLKKSDAAIAEAEAITKRRDGSQILLALAIASTGDVPRFQKFLDKKKVQRFFLEDCYRDEDLGPLLRSDAFRTVRERYPPPANLLPNAGFDDDLD